MDTYVLSQTNGSEVGQSLNGFGFVATFCCNVCLLLSAQLDVFCTVHLLFCTIFHPVCLSVFGTLSDHLGMFLAHRLMICTIFNLVCSSVFCTLSAHLGMFLQSVCSSKTNQHQPHDSSHIQSGWKRGSSENMTQREKDKP